MRSADGSSRQRRLPSIPHLLKPITVKVVTEAKGTPSLGLDT
jgi:hypothetical protein